MLARHLTSACGNGAVKLTEVPKDFALLSVRVRILDVVKQGRLMYE